MFGLSTVVFFYGGWPFRTGLVAELRRLQPGMMTLIALATRVAYFYSSAGEQGIKASEVRDLENLPGRGAQALVEGRRIAMVSPGYLRERSIQPPSEDPHALMAEGKTVVFVLEADQPIGAIALADVVRPESREAIARLKAKGVQCMMLTGDSSAVAERVAADLGLDDYFAEVLIVRAFASPSAGGRGKSAREILDERYTRGEISKEEYDERKRTLA